MARYSTEEQRRHSIRAQHRYNRAAIESLEIGEVEWTEISDEGVSGELCDRPGITELRRGIDLGLWDLIICEDSSRLYRNVNACVTLVGNAVDKGIRVICIGDDVDTAEDDWDARLTEAQQHHCRDNRHTRRRIRRAFDDLWSIGAAIGPLKAGHKRRATNPDEKDRKKRGPYFDELDDRWVPQIFEAYERIAGVLKSDPTDGSAPRRVGEPAWSVARWLTNQGVPKTNGKVAPWTAKEVIALIQLSVYRGEDTHGATRSVRQHSTGGSVQRRNEPDDVKRRTMSHLRIVPDWLWYRANEAIASRRRGSPRRGGDNPLTGVPRDSRRPLSRLFYCFCDRKMYGEGRNEGGYRCAGARSGECWCKATALMSRTHENIAQEIAGALLPERAHVDAFVDYCQHRLRDDAHWQSEEDRLAASERSLWAKCQRLAASIEETTGGAPQTLVQLLSQREGQAAEATAELQAWRHQRATRPEMPTSESILAAIESASRRLVDFDADVGVLLEQIIVGEIRSVPYQQFGTNKVVLRAEFELNLAAILPEQLVAMLSGASDWQPSQWLPIKQLKVDLFEPSSVPTHALNAYMLSALGVKYERIGEILGIAKRQAYLAAQLGTEMHVAGIVDPYIRLEHAPNAVSRWRSNRSLDITDTALPPDEGPNNDANAA